MERRRTFSREFKLEAVRLVTERGVAVAQAAKDLDVHENVLRKWVRELREEPQEAFPGNGKQKARHYEPGPDDVDCPRTGARAARWPITCWTASSGPMARTRSG